MGWERRAGKFYYYRKQRRGRRVHSMYVGEGLIGQLCARLDREREQQRMAARATCKAMREIETSIDRRLRRAEAEILAVLCAALHAAGYHKHKGQWRKKREEKQAVAIEEAHG